MKKLLLPPIITLTCSYLCCMEQEKSWYIQEIKRLREAKKQCVKDCEYEYFNPLLQVTRIVRSSWCKGLCERKQQKRIDRCKRKLETL